ncbi:MAG: 3-dehydroquinate synthase [Clostridiales bacterium]|nr:3-dehydroquinate synthase [Clostridiales bacterium]
MTYPVHIRSCWSDLPKCLAQAGLNGRRFFIVTDENVARLYLEDVQAALSPFFGHMPHFILPPGEAAKSLENTSALLTSFARAGLDRSSVVVALGGGAVSDVAGFAASIYMRGISYITVPTTLLAMADSSVGGKTGIDFIGIKNLVGSFHNPCLVYINPAALKTLDTAQYISGLAEVIKYGIILDSGLFDYICDNRAKIAAQNPAVLEKIIRESLRIKSEIVTGDEREAGQRRILNYGHTFGHAIEALCNFSLPHGHCVALGMVCAANFSHNMGKMTMFHVEHIKNLLEFFGIPVKLPKGLGMTADDIYNMMLKDKKVRNGALALIISHEIGTVEIIEGVEKQEVLRAIGSISRDSSLCSE